MRYTLTIDAPDIRSLRRLLKAMLRRFGVRVVEITKGEPVTVTSSNTPDSSPIPHRHDDAS